MPDMHVRLTALLTLRIILIFIYLSAHRVRVFFSSVSRKNIYRGYETPAQKTSGQSGCAHLRDALCQSEYGPDRRITQRFRQQRRVSHIQILRQAGIMKAF